ncbi:thioredoxin [Bacillus sp. TS-2]|nr:thioredoxin [Bacillus sp. TS-2]
MQRRLTLIIMIIALLSIVLTFVLTDTAEVGHSIGDIAYDFTLPSNQDGIERLSDYSDKVVILNLWASWCEPCVDEMPELMDFAEDYQEYNIEVITVNMQTFERTLNDAPNFIEEIGLTLPVFFDSEGVVYEKYQPMNFPMTYIINDEGIIDDIFKGEVNYEMLENSIQHYVNESS